MDALTTTALSGLAAFCVLALVYLWAKAHAEDLRQADDMLDRHYAAAQRLIGDETVPASVIHFLSAFAGQVGHPRLARTFAAHLCFGKLAATNANVTPEAKRFQSDMRKLTAKQLRDFASMLVFGMGASAASDPILSRVYIHALLMFFSTSGRANAEEVSVDRAQTAAMDLSSRGYCVA